MSIMTVDDDHAQSSLGLKIRKQRAEEKAVPIAMAHFAEILSHKGNRS